MADADQRMSFLATSTAAAGQDIAMVSPDMPLRANLSALDNIALIPQYRANLAYDKATDQAWNLLVAAGYEDCFAKRDPDLGHTERCVVKLLRAAIAQPPIILIDRPAMLLPDRDYPPFLYALLEKLSAHLNDCWIVDYTWNRPLYDAAHELTEMTRPR